MSDAIMTVEMVLQALANTFQAEADAGRATAFVTASDPLIGAVAQARADTFGLAANLTRQRLAELGDYQSTHDALIKATAEARHYEGLLVELGKLALAGTRGDKDAAQRSGEILAPYVALALPPNSGSVQ